jgi:hypothetical protein
MDGKACINFCLLFMDSRGHIDHHNKKWYVIFLVHDTQICTYYELKHKIMNLEFR